MPATEHGRRMGHEFLGVVEEIGSDVSGLEARRPGRRAVRLGGQHLRLLRARACRRPAGTAASGARTDVDGGQGEAVRVPQAQGTLVKLPGRPRTPRCCRRC